MRYAFTQKAAKDRVGAAGELAPETAESEVRYWMAHGYVIPAPEDSTIAEAPNDGMVRKANKA